MILMIQLILNQTYINNSIIDNNESTNKLSNGAIIVGISGGISFVSIIIVVILYYIMKKNNSVNTIPMLWFIQLKIMENHLLMNKKIQ